MQPSKSFTSRDNISQAVNNRDYSTAISELKKLEKTNFNQFISNNYPYLLARSLELNGNLSESIRYFGQVAASKSVLREYALLHLSGLMRKTSNSIMERVYLQQLIAEVPNSLLLRTAGKRIVRSNIESRNYNAAISYIEGGNISSNAREGTKIEREDQILLGVSLLYSGQPTRAREVFQMVIDQAPDPNQPDDYSLSATRELDKLDNKSENFGKSVGDLAEDTYLQRAAIYQFNRNFALARLHYKKLIEKFPTSSNVEEANYQIGRGYIQDRDDKNAAKSFNENLTKFPEGDFAKDSLYQSASAYANMGESNEAIKRYRQYIEKYPDANNLERSYLNIIDAYRDAGDVPNALAAVNEQRNAFPGGMGEAVALFAQAKIDIARENWGAALNDLNLLSTMKDLGGTRIAGGTNKEEVAFMQALMNEKLGRIDAAIEGYISIPDGANEYYGWRATEHLRAIAANPKTSANAKTKLSQLAAIASATLSAENALQVKDAAQNFYRISPTAEQLKRVARSYVFLEGYKSLPSNQSGAYGRMEIVQKPIAFGATNRHRVIANELLFLGIADEAAPEIERGLLEEYGLTKTSELPQEVQLSLAKIYNKGDFATRGVGYFESRWRKMPRDFMIELIPQDQLELLYPKPYPAPLIKYGSAESVDPRYMLSIMRQESRFRADVKSAAAARGLMQIISTTSQKIADEMKVTNFAQDDLYDPPVAIRFGAHYLGNIFRDFPSEPVAVAASYNGGEDRMARWLARAKTNDPDRYSSEIVFTQTKDYANKVMANYRVYSYLYDSNLKPNKNRN